jgi:hypothetical protein
LQKHLICSECFNDEGLRIDARQIGVLNKKACRNCNKKNGSKLTARLIENLAYRYFVKGTSWKVDYGAAPLIEFNKHQKTSIDFKEPLKSDVVLIENNIHIGFFEYGPRLWMLGQIEPLKKLQTKKYRKEIIHRVVHEYPSLILTSEAKFYRLRKNPKDPENHSEYDSPPKSGTGRLDSNRLPILYASPDLEVCIHECRATAIDRLFVSTLRPKSNLKLLNLAVVLEEDCTEFESLDISVQFLFYAESHSYEISREIAKAARKLGFDGIIYPSYFSSLRTGSYPTQTIYGMSIRRFPQYKNGIENKTIPNVALFGRPIKEKKIFVECINKVILNRIDYHIHFGPTGY